MKQSLILILLLLSNYTFSQCNGRYQNSIFSNVDTIKDINYSDIFNDNFHKMDIYMPSGDTEINRPLIIFIHGGSYIGGNKSLIDCVDFCESFAKKGYVTASINYRLASNQINFVLSQEEQYLTVLKSVADVKSAIRYFRKDYINNDSYGIDPNTIFIGGSSAGAVTAIHSCYIDTISDLPITSTPNGSSIQTLVANMGGLEGDAGNYGYSSKVSGVISFAGGINNVNWIDVNDEPLVSCQGNADQTIDYNCGPGLGISTVLTLCGSNEMHIQADNMSLLNDKLVFQGADHDWFQNGNNDNRFIQALDFTTSFLYPLLPCNNTTTHIADKTYNKKLLKIVDVLGREVKPNNNNPLFYIYNDGSVEKKVYLFN